MIYHKTWQKAVMKEREFNKLTIHVTVCCCRKISDGHFDTAGLKTPAMKSSKNWTYAYLLECVLRLHFSILTQVRTSCLGKGAAHSGLCLLIPMNITKALLRRQIPRPTQCRQSLVEILFPSRLFLRRQTHKETFSSQWSKGPSQEDPRQACTRQRKQQVHSHQITWHYLRHNLVNLVKCHLYIL